MTIFPLFEGSFSVDQTKKFVPFDPLTDNPKDRPASLFISIQPFLVSTPNSLVLFDCGLGYTNESGALVIHENIRKAGFEPEDVTHVLMSHLHFDHSGGMVYRQGGRTELSFPNAEYVVQRGEWENAYAKPSDSYNTSIFDTVQRSGNLHFVEGFGSLNDEIAYELTGAHCEFHQVFLLRSGTETVFFGGDVLPEPEQLLRKFVAKYDFDGRLAMELREQYGKRAAEEHWSCLFYHGTNKTVAFVEYKNDAFFIQD